MFQKFVAKISTWAGLPFKDVTNLLTWSDGKSVDFGNRNLLVASASDENGAAVYTTLEPTWLLNGVVFRPKLSTERTTHAGDALDSTIVREAQAQGIERVFFVLPPNAQPQSDEVRVIVRNIPRKITITCNDGSSVEKQLSIDPQTNTAKFLN